MERPCCRRSMAAREWGLGDSSRVVVEPSVLFLNLMLPGQVLPTHTDVPTFLGATRKTGVPEWVLSSMLHSKLFANERVKVLTGVLYFGEEDWMAQQGGEIVVYLNVFLSFLFFSFLFFILFFLRALRTSPPSSLPSTTGAFCSIPTSSTTLSTP